MAVRLVIFDVDGTLANSQHNIINAMTDAFAAEGLPAPSAAAVRGVIGLSLLETMERLLPDADAARHARLAEAYREAFFTRRARPDFEEPLFPGALDLLDSLDRQGVLLALATGKSRRGALAFLERHGLGPRFLSVRTADDGPGKPDPWMIQDTLATLGQDAEHAVMIGDTTYDIEMARRAGVRPIGVSWGSHPVEALTAAGAWKVADSFTDVGAFLAE
ncbi:HAD-IA family hydrolase [Pararhodospirillum photometricum]|uniref:Haloacid dehalogenase-like hydrolase n=1 Tax=Pararhodospirillum photometricum DSM 122 TaxID=1150469 RepID=H6SKG3_PARPM|nr:HAD-IA family hydrolase [Pararhodospirillum photometricum]CCG08478.1 Haloacid dehalogenase-like hydrolase [Pararhodospirillum photometricum DSM 122]